MLSCAWFWSNHAELSSEGCLLMPPLLKGERENQPDAEGAVFPKTSEEHLCQSP